MADKFEIEFTEEQVMLLDTAMAFCKEKSSYETVRALIETESGFDAAVWKEITELGWAGIAIPESYGGSGLTLGEVVPIYEPMGRYLLASPLYSSTLAAQVLLAAGSEQQKSDLLPKVADGSVIATVAACEPDSDWNLETISTTAKQDGDQLVLKGTKTFVTDAVQSDYILVLADVEGQANFVLLSKDQLAGAKLQRETVIDETRRCFRVQFDDLAVPASTLLMADSAQTAVEKLKTTAWLLLAAEATGGANGVLELTLEYLTTRKQFGKLIGSYQALKHPIVDCHCDIEFSRSQLYYAATLMAQTEHDAEAEEVALRMAKAQAADSYAHTSDRAIQFHGGFGFTYDCNAQLHLRRACWGQYQFGDAQHHRKHLAAALLDA